MNEVRIEQRKPVTNVSVHQIAEPAILFSDQPSLIVGPPDHTPPRPTPNSPPPFENIPTDIERTKVI